MRTVGSVGEVTEQKIYAAAAELIAKHGYEGINLRQLAKDVGVQVGSLYNYISSKQELLFNILNATMNDLLDAVKADVGAEAPPIERLRAFVKLHIQYHTNKLPAVVIATSELRSLEPENYKKIVRLRAEYDTYLQQILKDGCANGSFTIENVRLCEYAIIGMLTGVCVWYNPRGTLPINKLTSYYQEFVLRLVGANDAPSVSEVPPIRAKAGARR
jgi:AcrR family transcriptional regulator